MNRKKKATKKFTFEPKIPTQQVEEVAIEEKPEETLVDSNNDYSADSLKGKFGPLLLDDKPTVMNSQKLNNFLICIPELTEGMKLVVFEDNSFGLRVGDKIIGLDTMASEGDIVVDHKESLYKIGDVETYLIPKGVL